jgi:hypothetical protein
MNQNLLNIQKIQGVKMCKVKNNKWQLSLPSLFSILPIPKEVKDTQYHYQYHHRTPEISKTGHKSHFWQISLFFKGLKNRFL